MGTKKKRWRDREQPGIGSHAKPGGERIPSTPPKAKHGVTQPGAAAARLWGGSVGARPRLGRAVWWHSDNSVAGRCRADGSCSLHKLLNES